MRPIHRHLALVMAVGFVLVGCDHPAGTSTTETALAATENLSSPPPGREIEEAADPIEDLNTKLESIGAKVVAKPSEEAREPNAQNLEELAREVDELRAEVQRLQETVDLTISYVVGDLQEENRRLREEVARAYGVTSDTLEDGRDVVMLNSGDLENFQRLSDPDATPHAEDGPIDYGELGYLPVDEWGRSPDEARSLGADVPSLKGMICAVSPNLDDAELSDLGRQLRDEFDAYENIVIEVFDDEDAARAYADQNIRSTKHNVLSVQKDGESGKDFILLHRNGVSVDVPS